MNSLIKLIAGVFCAAGSLAALIALVFTELNFLNTAFAVYFGLLLFIGSVSFFIILRNEDNEETNPLKEKAKR